MSAFINIRGETGKARRQVARSESFGASEVQDPERLVDLLRKMERRVQELEARQAPDYAEFQVLLGTAAALTKLNHNFGCPVRYYVTDFTRAVSGSGAYPTACPVLIRDASSTDNMLVLRSHVAGRAVIRVERSQYGTEAV